MCDNNVDVGKRFDDLECSMFESPAKRSRPSPFVLSQAVPKRFLKAYTHVPEKAMGTVSLFGRIFPALVALLTGELSFHQYKVSLVLKVEMTKGDGKTKVQTPYFASKPYTILSQHDIENAIDKGHQAIDAQMDKWTREGSGWVVTRVLCLYVSISKYTPLKGSSYIELPKYLKKKEAIIYLYPPKGRFLWRISFKFSPKASFDILNNILESGFDFHVSSLGSTNVPMWERWERDDKLLPDFENMKKTCSSKAKC